MPAGLTPQDIQDLSEPVESIYVSMVNELLVNISRHVQKPTRTHTAAWEVQKLSELGQLTQENARIINKWIKAIPDTVKATMETTRRQALEQLEKDMEKAARDGVFTPPVRDSTVDVLQTYLAQSYDKLNLVNTTMLKSSVDQYSKLVQTTADLAQRYENSQDILNQAAGNVVVGKDTRLVAMREAILKIGREGLAGFYDKAGRSWTPEAYVNMDIRTTVHNVAIESVRNRMDDYGTQVFQVSSHAGARPLCYPYQGRFYSWDNSAGEIELGNGERVQYEALSSTSYGMAAGLFGINCGHYPIPVVPGVTIPHGADNIQDEAANTKAYKESQEQRLLERRIRAAKRELEMLGDVATDQDKQRVQKAQEQMRDFIARTGRTRRYDREQVYITQQVPVTPKP